MDCSVLDRKLLLILSLCVYIRLFLPCEIRIQIPVFKGLPPHYFAAILCEEEEENDLKLCTFEVISYMSRNPFYQLLKSGRLWVTYSLHLLTENRF